MIELTPQQWQAIAQEEQPTVIDPESKTAYVIIRKEQYDRLRAVREAEAEAASVLRVAWMRRMGLDAEDIAESLRDEPPRDVHEELKQLKALDNLDQNTPAAEVLRNYAVKY
jgi:hypothetical protein